MNLDNILKNIKITDVHTHLFPFHWHKLHLSGIINVLDYHYLIAEFLINSKHEPRKFYNLSKIDRAKEIWECLFKKNLPVSEATRSVIHLLNILNINPECNFENLIKQYTNKTKDFESFENTIFETAGIEKVIMTNNPIDETERHYYQYCYDSQSLQHERYLFSIRLDDYFNFYINNEMEIDAIIEDIKKWREKLNPVYLALSPNEKLTTKYKYLLDMINQITDEMDIPIFLFIDSKRDINPDFKLAGDGIYNNSLEKIESILQTFPDVQFFITSLSRENQYELTVLARKFQNIKIFGIWWFLNNDYFIEEVSKMRINLLGNNFIPFHSDARVLDQLVFKWDRFKNIFTKVYCDYISELKNNGINVKNHDIINALTTLFRLNMENVKYE